MPAKNIRPTGAESSFGEDELIVSKTDLKGHLTYVNDVFLRVSYYGLDEVIGQPHSMIRHPDMPRCVFKLLWDSIQAKKEIFAYVVNMAKNGDHYWVLAHVTPTFDAKGKIVGYHSNRRLPDEAAVRKIDAIYREVLAEEQRHVDRKQELQVGYDLLQARLRTLDLTYDRFVFSLTTEAA